MPSRMYTNPSRLFISSAAILLIVFGAVTAPAQQEAAKVAPLPSSAPAEPVPPKIRDEVYIDGQVLGAGERAESTLLGVESVPGRIVREFLDIETPEDRRPREETHYIVRFHTADMVAAREQIESAGGKPLQYLPDAAWVVRMSGAASLNVEKLESVEWVGRYKRDYKESPALRSYLDSPDVLQRSSSESARGATHGIPIDDEEATAAADALPSGHVRNLTLEIRLFPASDADAAAKAIEGAGGIVLETSTPSDGQSKLRVAIERKNLEALFDLEAVQLVELDVPFSLDNDKAAGVMKIAALSNPRGLHGEGQIIGHADSGLDVGVEANLHPDLRGRIKKAIAYGRKAEGDWSDQNGHGTHTAGSIIGDGTESHGRYRGMAPKAQLVHQSIVDEFGKFKVPPDLGVLLEDAYAEGARIHSDSWGVDLSLNKNKKHAGVYLDGEEVDRWAWGSGNPRDMLVVLAAGNHGELGVGSVGSPATAKNGLSVGATENARPDLGAEGDDVAQVAAFSSQGPVRQKRYKPDLVAPGTWVVSTRTHGDVHLLDDDMEIGLQGWTKIPDSSAWAIVDDHCPSGHGCWASNPGGNYADNQDTSLISNWAKGYTANTLVFRARWRHVEPAGHGLSVRFESGDGSIVGYRLEAQNRNWPGWDYVVLPVPAKAKGNSKIRIIFRLKSDGSNNSDGFFIDDILLSTFGSWSFLSSASLAAAADGEDSSYTLCGGTSMATPLVAGAAALVREYLQKANGADPSAEIIKALLINGARNLVPSAGRPNPISGWGRIDLESSLFPPDPRRVLILDRRTIGANQAITIPLTVTAASEELRATLVWADPPGEALVHDLDLTLIDPSGRKHFMPGATPENHDTQNNVEGVDVAAPAVGNWTIEVRSALLQVPQQPFALVISGGVDSL